MTKTVENRSIKGQTLQGCHYFIISQKNLKLPSKDHGRSIFYNHQYSPVPNKRVVWNKRVGWNFGKK